MNLKEQLMKKDEDMRQMEERYKKYLDKAKQVHLKQYLELKPIQTLFTMTFVLLKCIELCSCICNKKEL